MERHERDEVAKSPLEVQEMPDQIANTLSHIVRQIDILTQTMNILEVIFLFLTVVEINN